jgi:hypothetical protein
VLPLAVSLLLVLAQAPASAPREVVAVPGLVLEGADSLRPLLDAHLTTALGRAGFQVLGAPALRAAGLEVPAAGCLSVQPLCGAAPGVSMVVMGRVRAVPAGYQGMLELRTAPSGRLLWRGSLEAESAEELGRQMETHVGAGLLSHARPEQRPVLSVRQWGYAGVTVGALGTVAGTLLLMAGNAKMQRLESRGDPSAPLFREERLRLEVEGPRDQLLGVVGLGVGVASLAAGFTLLALPLPEVKPITLALQPTRPGLLLVGTLP